MPVRNLLSRPNRPRYLRGLRGFTLIELLVALSIMALMAVLSWRGLDGMARSQAQTSQRADQVLTLQAGLAQWKLDLDMMTQTPNVIPLDWDGRVLRLTRRTAASGDGLQVIAWTRRNDDGGQWLRWQSPLVRTAGSWTESWDRASSWAQNASAVDRAREVRVSPLEEWQIFYHRGGAWSNPLSSAGTALPGAAGAATGLPAPASPGTAVIIPDGVRAVLVLPSGPAISGKLTIDWVAPTLAGDKS